VGVEGYDIDGIAGRPVRPSGNVTEDTAWNDEDPSLIEDFEALFSDGKNYVEAELRYQKTRVAFARCPIKRAFVYRPAAFGLPR